MSDASVPSVSVVIPCYMAAHFASDSVASVLAQDYPDIQILVVNDGSPDGVQLRQALEPYSHAIELLERPHQGLAATRNEGIRAANGEFIAFLDADDEWKTDFLRRQLELIRESGADLVYGDAELFGDVQAGSETVMDSYPSVGPATGGAIAAGGCTVVMSTVLARTDAILGVGGFDAGIRYCEDLDLWLRMAVAGKRFAYHREAVSRRRIHAANMSDNAVGMAEGWLEVTGRLASQLELSESESKALARRSRRNRGEVHLSAAKANIRKGDRVAARAELWESLRCQFTLKRAAVLGALVVLPGPAMRRLGRRLRQDDASHHD